MLCTFGNDGASYAIFDNCDLNYYSFSNLGYYFDCELPNGIKRGTVESVSYLAGSGSFKILEIEVY